MSARLVITGSGGDFARLATFVEEGVRSVDGMEDEVLLRLQLAIHELVVNVARHAYSSGGGEISVRLAADERQLKIEVVDRGRPFTGALQRPLPAAPDTHGYGLPIISAVVDRVDYRRLGDENHWRLELDLVEAL